MCCSRAKLAPSPHTSPCRQTRLPCDSLSASSLSRPWAACTRPREKRRPWRGELICPTGRQDRSDSEGLSCHPKAEWGASPCWGRRRRKGRGSARRQAAPEETLLSVLNFSATFRRCSHFWMYVCFWEESHRHGSFLKERCSAETETLVLLLSCRELPPPSFFFLLKSK